MTSLGGCGRRSWLSWQRQAFVAAAVEVAGLAVQAVLVVELAVVRHMAMEAAELVVVVVAVAVDGNSTCSADLY